MAETIRVRGLTELRRDLKLAGDGLPGEMRKMLKAIAEPVAATARELADEFGPPTVSGLQAGTRGSMAVVRQRRRKTTGKRPDFGAIQMRVALIPALEAHEADSIVRAEEMLDHIEHMYGL